MDTEQQVNENSRQIVPEDPEKDRRGRALEWEAYEKWATSYRDDRTIEESRRRFIVQMIEILGKDAPLEIVQKVRWGVMSLVSHVRNVGHDKLQRYKNKTTFWQGKFDMVRRENNALRKANRVHENEIADLKEVLENVRNKLKLAETQPNEAHVSTD